MLHIQNSLYSKILSHNTL